MDKQVCRQCGRIYNYCRACMLKSIPWKAAGFCSKECSAEFKKPKPIVEEVVPVVEDVEVVITDDKDMTISEDE